MVPISGEANIPRGDSRQGSAARPATEAQTEGKPVQAASDNDADGTAATSASQNATSPVGQGDYVVEQGDCVSSIAKETGHFWEKIWNAPGNAELKRTRKNPNVLLPGDRVAIPGMTQKHEPGETEMRHRFVRRGEPAMLRLRLVDESNAPRASERYTLEIDGERHSGTTDADGNICRVIPGNAQRGKLTIGADTRLLEYDLALGAVDPIESITGVQARLNNLGFACGPVDGVLGPGTAQALRAFQALHGLTESGEPDAATRDRLLQEYRA